ncbi:MAG: hypothetical protein HYV40_02900 [Candidatus Levybacteria bacterium]|nr:hypothetical protein [Candidatus Levybacteria bacterium]
MPIAALEAGVFANTQTEAPFGGKGGGGADFGTPRALDASAAFLPQTESAEGLPLFGQEILVTGGSRGTGATVSLDLVGMGAKVTILTRNPEKIEGSVVKDAKTSQAGGKISGEIDIDAHITPVKVDFLNRRSIKNVGNELESKGGDKFSAEINVSAGGIEFYALRLTKAMGKLATIRTEQGEEAFVEARAKLQQDVVQWVIRSMPMAMKVNYAGPSLLLEDLIQKGLFTDEAKYINFASAWSEAEKVAESARDLDEDTIVPNWYRTISESKKAHDDEIHSDEGRSYLESNGVFPYTVVGQVIDDTGVGRMVNQYLLPLLSEDDRKRYTDTNKPMMKADMSRAVQIMLLSDPNDPELWTPGQPRKLYVLGPTGTPEEARANIVREIPQDHPMLTFRSPI